MTVVATTFRQQFPAFGDIATYDDSVIDLYIGVAIGLMDPTRWGDQLDYGVSLFVAHHLVLTARDEATVAAGGIPGTVQGLINSKSVDKVSVGYDTQGLYIDQGDFWNMTTYGIRFLHLARMMGTGGAQVFGYMGPLGNGGGGWPTFAAYPWSN